MFICAEYTQCFAQLFLRNMIQQFNTLTAPTQPCLETGFHNRICLQLK